MAGGNKPATGTAERKLVITRVFDAPCEYVFGAWTEPSQMAQWWGPKGFTNPVCELDPRPGGAIRIVMRAPNGVEHPMTGVFREIAERERLVFTAVPEDRGGNPLLEAFITATFAEHDGKTKLTVQASAVGLGAEAARMLEGMEQGWSQSLERLNDHLGSTRNKRIPQRNSATTSTADREITATRVITAPRERVFTMLTDPKHVAQWWGPRGFTTTTLEMNVRPGGVWRFVMHGPDGRDYQNKIVYIEILKPERLVYSHVSGPHFRMTATFAEQGDETTLTARMLFESAAQRDKVAKEFGAVEGLNQTLDRLEEQLAKS